MQNCYRKYVRGGANNQPQYTDRKGKVVPNKFESNQRLEHDAMTDLISKKMMILCRLSISLSIKTIKNYHRLLKKTVGLVQALEVYTKIDTCVKYFKLYDLNLFKKLINGNVCQRQIASAGYLWNILFFIGVGNKLVGVYKTKLHLRVETTGRYGPQKTHIASSITSPCFCSRWNSTKEMLSAF